MSCQRMEHTHENHDLIEMQWFSLEHGDDDDGDDGDDDDDDDDHDGYVMM